MDRLNIDDYMNYHPFSQEVLVKKISDNNFDEDICMRIYYEDVMFNGRKSNFVVFINDFVATTSIEFPCKIDTNDVFKVAKDISRSYLQAVDNYEFDEFGVVIDHNTDEYIYCCCPRNIADKYCLDNKDFFEVYKKWSKKYGLNSKKHKEQMHEDIIMKLSEYLNINGNNEMLVNDLIKYIKTYSNVK